MTRGYLSIVLHAHLPFVRHPEHDRFLEELIRLGSTEACLPAVHEPTRMGGCGGRIGLAEFRKGRPCGRQLPQGAAEHRIDKPALGLKAGFPGQLHGFMDGRMRGYAVKEEQLVESQVQQRSDRRSLGSSDGPTEFIAILHWTKPHGGAATVFPSGAAGHRQHAHS